MLESGLLDQVGLVAAELLPEDFVVTEEAPVGAPGDGEQMGGLHVRDPVRDGLLMGKHQSCWGLGHGRTGVQDCDAREVSLEVGPEGLQEHRVGLLEVEELLLGSADAAAETAGNTAGWAGGSTFSLTPSGGSEPDHWIWPRLAAASCG